MEAVSPGAGIAPIHILPDTCVELVVHFSDPYKTTFFDNTASVQPRSFVVCQMKRHMSIEPNGSTGLIAARFTAAAAYRFVKSSMKSIADREVPLSSIWKEMAGELEDRIYHANSTDARNTIFQSFLYTVFRKNQIAEAPVIAYCIQEIRKAKGLISVEDLSYKTGYSNRQLLRQFDRLVGLSPKEFARITKFLNSLDILARHPGCNLTNVAYEGGYYDQAHFIRDFKEYSGLTPREYLQSANVVY